MKGCNDVFPIGCLLIVFSRLLRSRLSVSVVAHFKFILLGAASVRALGYFRIQSSLLFCVLVNKEGSLQCDIDHWRETLAVYSVPWVHHGLLERDLCWCVWSCWCVIVVELFRNVLVIFITKVYAAGYESSPPGDMNSHFLYRKGLYFIVRWLTEGVEGQIYV